jgi:hypothetical protein
MKNRDHSEFEDWLRRRTKSLREDEVSAEFLAAQRRSIYRRIDRPESPAIRLRWALSFALLVLIAAGSVVMERRHTANPAISATVSDEQLFSDLAAMDQSNEPKAIEPIHGLFQ